MLGERVPAPQAIEWGLVNRVVADDEFDGGGRRARRAARHRARRAPTRAPSASSTRWLFARMDEQLELEARDPAGDGRSCDFAEGVQAFLEKRAAALLGPLSAPSRPRHPLPRPDTARPRPKLARRRRPRRAARPAGPPLIAAPAASRGSPPRVRRLPNADSIKTLYILILVARARRLHRRRGRADLLAGQVPRPQGRVAAQIHGNTRLEIGWTVGAAVILIFITVATFVMLPTIKNPAASRIDANGNPVRLERRSFASTDQPPPPKGASMTSTSTASSTCGATSTPAAATASRYTNMYVPVGMTVRSTSAPTTSPTRGGSRRSAARRTRSPATRTRPGSRSRRRDPGGQLSPGPVRRAVRAQPRQHVRRVIACRSTEWKAWYDRQGRSAQQAPRRDVAAAAAGRPGSRPGQRQHPRGPTGCH